MADIAQANAILACDDDYLNDPSKYNEYFEASLEKEAQLSGEAQQVLSSLKEQYNLTSRLFRRDQNNEQKAKNLVSAHNALAKFRVRQEFPYRSLLDFAQQAQEQQEQKSHIVSTYKRFTNT